MDYVRRCARPIVLFPLDGDPAAVDVSTVLPGYHYRWRFRSFLSAGGEIEGLATHLQTSAVKALLLRMWDLTLRSPVQSQGCATLPLAAADGGVPAARELLPCRDAAHGMSHCGISATL